MLKLYKRDNYWQTWDRDVKSGIVHWGIVGQTGHDKIVKSGLLTSFKVKIKKEIAEKIKEGYEPVDIVDHYTLLIKFKTDGITTSEVTKKKILLETRLNDTLRWTGVGHCDGINIKNGTLEACCLVIDFE